MKREIISEALNGLSDRYISEAASFSSKAVRLSPERNAHIKKKRAVSLVLSAALLLALGGAAYAVWSVHTARQQEIKNELHIEENNISGYAEYKISEEQSTGIVLLSTVNDGEFQRVYVNICPVEPDKVRNFWKADVNKDGSLDYYEFSFTWDNEHFGIARPARLTDSDDTDEIINAAYDEEAKTLTLECACIGFGDEPFNMTVVLNRVTAKNGGYNAEIIQTFGTVTVCPTESGVKSIRFETPYVFENNSTGGKGKFIGTDIGGLNADILITHENMETMYTPDNDLEGEAKATYLKEQQGWIQAADKLTQNLTLIFSDGSSRTGFGVLRSYYENGAVVLRCGLGSESINAEDVVSISIGDTIIWKIPA